MLVLLSLSRCRSTRQRCHSHSTQSPFKTSILQKGSRLYLHDPKVRPIGSNTSAESPHNPLPKQSAIPAILLTWKNHNHCTPDNNYDPCTFLCNFWGLRLMHTSAVIRDPKASVTHFPLPTQYITRPQPPKWQRTLLVLKMTNIGWIKNFIPSLRQNLRTISTF